jgi:hypothetical protein
VTNWHKIAKKMVADMRDVAEVISESAEDTQDAADIVVALAERWQREVWRKEGQW